MLERVAVGDVCVSQYSAQEPQINPQVKNTFLKKEQKKKEFHFQILMNFSLFFCFFFVKK
jgi:hypothetical protein